VKLTVIRALALCLGATWKLFHTTLEPLVTTLPVEALTLVTWTLLERWLVTVWAKSRAWALVLSTVSVMVQVSVTPAVGVVVQLAVWITLKGAEGAVTVRVAEAVSPSGCRLPPAATLASLL
jgi:hypothetical protein